MADTVSYLCDVTRLGRFSWRWELVEKHHWTHTSSFTVLASGRANSEVGARTKAKRALRRHRRTLKWDVFSNVSEIA